MRVATRRLRSDLRTFAPLLEEEWATALRTELGWLGELLGTVRDPDVMLLRFERRMTKLSDPARQAAAGVLRSLRSDRRRALAELLAALRDERYVILLDCLVEASRAPALTSQAELPADEVLPELARR